MAGQQIKEKYQNGCHLKTINHNDQKSNQHIAGAHVNIHTKYESSVTIHVDRRGNQRKEPKLLPFENYKSESLDILYAYEVYMSNPVPGGGVHR